MESNFRKTLLLRAKIYERIRGFFADLEVLEVETPLLLAGANPSPWLENFQIDGLYLQTSPELAMKRLLAMGSGDIYQLCKAFRKNELGRLHNPEFTILEWYRLGIDHHQLMDEVEKLIITVFATSKFKRFTYQEIYESVTGVNPHDTTLKELQQLTKRNGIEVEGIGNDQDTWVQLIFTHLIEPKLDENVPIFIYDFPKSQAMLARIRDGKYQLASRFELYYQGIELANGFHELNDFEEQQRRFNADLARRRDLGLVPMSMDDQFINSVRMLPDCSGVALGIDRLTLIAVGGKSLDEVMPLRRN